MPTDPSSPSNSAPPYPASDLGDNTTYGMVNCPACGFLTGSLWRGATFSFYRCSSSTCGAVWNPITAGSIEARDANLKELRAQLKALRAGLHKALNILATDVPDAVLVERMSVIEKVNAALKVAVRSLELANEKQADIINNAIRKEIASHPMRIVSMPDTPSLLDHSAMVFMAANLTKPGVSLEMNGSIVAEAYRWAELFVTERAKLEK